MIKCDNCFESAEYLEEFANYKSCDNVSLEKLEEILRSNNICLWNYPLTEINHIMENNISVVLVRFPELYGGYEYRFCEIPDDEE